ncbi:Stk1 family PASTA domain-containing Ser/Thr kinase [Propionibacteriaceae bacterium Y1685]
MTGDPNRVGDRYELGDLLGRGGMAEVRRAIDTRLGRPVAVKQLRADLAGDPTFQARFRREAQSAAGLNHPNIVSVYDTGEEPDPRTGVMVPYIVMELVDGVTLRDILRDGRRLLPERAMELASGVLDALSYSHKAGIVHRDIKPANVMLTPAGDVKVMDFGIARAVADTSSTMTQTAAVIGTAQYLSPEQARGETVDARSDIYSAGCLLYELLVSRPPFVGESPVSVAYQHVREAPVPPSDLDPEITPEMDAIVLRSLAKDPADRYQSARQMKDDISRLLAGQQPLATSFPASSPTPGETATTLLVPDHVPSAGSPTGQLEQVDEVDEDDEKHSKAGRIAVIVIVVLALLAVIGSIIFFNLPPKDDPNTNPTPSASPVQMVQVPTLIGLTQEQAENSLEGSGLKAKINQVKGKDDNSVGTVVDADPKTGSVPVGSEITLDINVGPDKTEVPEVVGLSRQEAEKKLADAGFEDVTAEESTNEPLDAKPDEVLSVDPDEGEAVTKGTKITLTYATGEASVPNMVGLTRDAAEQLAKENGFTNVKVTEEESDQTAGEVIRQDPPADSRRKRTDEITLVIAKEKPEPTPTPTQSQSAPTDNPSTPGSDPTGSESGG